MDSLSKILTGLSLIAAGCAPPAYQAKQDYGLGHDSGVALYNIQQILAENCEGDSFANEQGLSCIRTVCTRYAQGYGSQSTGYHNTPYCADEVAKRVSLNWDMIKGVERQTCQGCFRVNLRVGDGNIVTLKARNSQQTGELEQALKIYLQQRNQ